MLVGYVNATCLDYQVGPRLVRQQEQCSWRALLRLLYPTLPLLYVVVGQLEATAVTRTSVLLTWYLGTS